MRRSSKQLKNNHINHFISSSLVLASKYNRGFQKIYYLSYRHSFSINNYIVSKFAMLLYSFLKNIFARIIMVRKHIVLIEWDIKDAFCNIFINSYIQWLLGIPWIEVYYHKTCLSFGFSTTFFIIILFTKIFHWILKNYPHFPIDCYLNNFNVRISATEVTPTLLA